MWIGRSIGIALSMMLAMPAAAQLAEGRGDQLLEAIRYGELQKVQELIKADPRLVNTRSQVGETPISLAIDQRSVPVLHFMLFNGADPERTFGDGQTPLIAAAFKGWSEGVDALLEMGAKVNGRNRRGETALVAAVQARNTRLVRRLLEAGADPDLADRLAGMSARDYAKRENRMPELLRLIEAKKPAKL